MNRRYTIVGKRPNYIELQTSIRSDIENEQGARIPPTQRREYDELQEQYDAAVFRTGPNPEYNCHGLTFASKRTGVYDQADLRMILNDDDYRQVPEDELQPGDIALYHSDDGDIEHSGIVLSTPETRLDQPIILSKWGNAGEVLHPVPNCPYDPTNVRYYRRLWLRAPDDEDQENNNG